MLWSSYCVFLRTVGYGRRFRGCGLCASVFGDYGLRLRGYPMGCVLGAMGCVLGGYGLRFGGLWAAF